MSILLKILIIITILFIEISSLLVNKNVALDRFTRVYSADKFQHLIDSVNFERYAVTEISPIESDPLIPLVQTIALAANDRKATTIQVIVYHRILLFSLWPFNYFRR
jgi:hypothetical protein